ncbi:MAG: hypothetical protein LBC77_08765 [Spirochaetaceae bacterium]|jgi:hypothetical protein|nr:hypothetical protein [Spirochaetaceae bacterium]
MNERTKEITEKTCNELGLIDIQLKIDNLPFKMSKRLMWEIAYWGQNQGSYEQTKKILYDKFGYEFSVSTIKQVTDYVGRKTYEAEKAEAEKCEKERQTMSIPSETDDIMCIMIDGSQVNTIEKNVEGSTWKEAKLGVLFYQKDVKKKKKKNTITNKEYISLLKPVSEFENHMFARAYHKGYPGKKTTVVVSDGAVWIKNMCEWYKSG